MYVRFIALAVSTEGNLIFKGSGQCVKSRDEWRPIQSDISVTVCQFATADNILKTMFCHCEGTSTPRYWVTPLMTISCGGKESANSAILMSSDVRINIMLLSAGAL